LQVFFVPNPAFHFKISPSIFFFSKTKKELFPVALFGQEKIRLIGKMFSVSIWGKSDLKKNEISFFLSFSKLLNLRLIILSVFYF